jgi:hypothetical protein
MVAWRMMVIALLSACSAVCCGPTTAPDRAAAADAASHPAPAIDAAVRPLLVRSCFPCHSDERADPWYAKLGPSSWSTYGARAALNFSQWDRYDGERRARVAGLIAAVTQDGSMPPADYTFFNHAARLGDAERAAVIRWASGAH